jgi:outer membrane protein OmpA-like peptidoglycan-associated protein
VVGQCDHFRAANYDNFLGCRRPEDVRAKLIEFDIDEDRIITASVGADQASEQTSDKSVTVVDRRADRVLFKPALTASSGEHTDSDVADY